MYSNERQNLTRSKKFSIPCHKTFLPYGGKGREIENLDFQVVQKLLKALQVCLQERSSLCTGKRESFE